MSELRVPSRSLPQPHYSTEGQEDAVSGFLNRKCVQEVGAKRSKDRSWQIFWCQVKGSILELYKVEGVRPKPQGEPPPRDVYPPPNMMKYKVGFIDLEDVLVELDYTSQLHKELQKRRRHLFRLVLPNDMEYIFQAPSNHQRTTWVVALQNSARRFEGDDIDKLIHQEIKIKAARCSIRQRSRQNVHSLKRVPLKAAGSFDEDYDFSPMTEVIGDPRLLVLKKRLQSKRDLLQQIETMYSSFVGENISMYTDALPFKPKQDSGGGVPVGQREGVRLKEHRRSLPEAQLNTTLEDSGCHDNGNRRASTGGATVPIIKRMPTAGEATDPSIGTITKLVRDFYLVPGAEWSLVREGQSVSVLGRLANGWYRCVALREAECQLEPIYAPSHSVISGLSELSADSGLPPSEGHSMVGVEPMAPPIPEEGAYPEDSDVFHDNVFTEEPHPPTMVGGGQCTSHVSPSNGHVTPPDGPVPPPVIVRKKRRSSSLERPLSYQMATEEVTLYFEEECLLTSATAHSQEHLVEPSGVPLGGGGDGEQGDQLQREGCAQEVSSQASQEGGDVATGHTSPGSSDASPSHVMDSTHSSQEEAGVGGLEPPDLGPSLRPSLASTRDSQASRDSLGVNVRDSVASSQTFLVLLPPDPAHLHLAPSHPQSRLMSLLTKEHRTGRYSLPLLGCIPPSALQPFTPQPAPTSPPIFPTHRPPSPSFSPTPSPTPSPVHHPLSPHMKRRPVKAASIDVDPCASYTSADHTHSNGTLLPPRDDHTHDHHSDDEVGMEMPIKQTRSRSLPPPLIHHSPPHSPSDGPIESNLDHSPQAYRRYRPQMSLSHHLTSSTPGKKSMSSKVHSSSAKSPTSSPQRAGRSPRRKPYEPIMILLDSGPMLLRKLFTRKKTIPKQMSVPEDESLTIPEDHRHHPSPSLVPPPPAVLDDDLGPGLRMQRVSSVSGRPVRSTGMGLVIGEESSSESESESEESTTSPTTSLHEDSLPFPPHTSPEPGSLPRSVDDSSVFASRENTPTGSLIRSASEHDSLKLRASPEQAPPTTQVPPLKRNTTLPAAFRMAALKSKQRTHSENVPSQKARSTRRKKRRSWGDATALEPPKVTGIFREPPRGEKRFVFLDPQQPKFGFRLESYGRYKEKGRVLQTFVQSVAPGSPAFMGGLYPGDAIMEVNGVSVRYAPVEEVVQKISSVPHTSSDKIKLMVEFVDGVTRLERMKKADELKYQMRTKQARLKELIAQEQQHLSPNPHLPSPHSIILAHELSTWGQTPPITDPGTRPFPHSRHLNNVVSLYQGHVTSLACDALVMPLCAVQEPTNERTLHNLLSCGGSDLLDELALAKQCRLGTNITTRGHQLPVLRIYHCAFGDLEESLLSCCRQALESANHQKYNTITFWIDGFTAAKVSPHVVLETVRLWLQEGTNSARFERVIFAARTSVSHIDKFLDHYFPLRPSFSKPEGEGDVAKGDSRKQDSEGPLETEQPTAGENTELEQSPGHPPTPPLGSAPTQQPSECQQDSVPSSSSEGSSGEPLLVSTAREPTVPATMIMIGSPN